MCKPEILWHYTHREAARKIIESGVLKVSEAERKLGDKHPTLWFSTNPVWEPTATKLYQDENGNICKMTKEQQYEHFGLFRFAVKYHEELITWMKYRHVSKLTTLTLNSMEAVGIKEGAHPRHWYSSLKNIPEKQWEAVQFWNGNEWIDYDEDLSL